MKAKCKNLIRAGLYVLFIVFSLMDAHALNDGKTKKEAYVKLTAIIDNLTQQPIFPTLRVINATDTLEVDASYSGVNESVTITLPDINLDYRVIVNGFTVTTLRSGSAATPDFKPDTILVTSAKLKEAKGDLIIPAIKLKREYASKAVELGEVSVKASKVVFYHRGDTLIYNADAFVTPEGSTLDALIAQLPGVKIDEYGVITANGRKVENLLLNGKDLFNGKGDILLENLPAYTVKDIAVYEKDGKMSEFLGRKAGDEQYVMDVRLKRDYHVGWLGNAEAGYGTHNKYLAKLFALRFSDNTSLSFNFKANNLTDMNKSSQYDDSWSPMNMLPGVTTIQTGGVNYNVQGLPYQWSSNGSVDVEHKEDNLVSGTMRQNYYPTGDTYDYMLNRNRSKSLRINTQHFVIKPIGEKVRLFIVPKFSYNRENNNGILNSASYNEPYDSLVSMIRNGDPAAFSRYNNFITRSIKESLRKGNSLNGGLNADVTVKTKTKGLENNVTFQGGGNYNRSHFENFDRYAIEYASEPTTGTSQYFKGFPDHKTEYRAGIQFQQFIDRSMPDHVQISYNYNGTDAVTTSNLYLLDHVSGFDWENSVLGMLPSASQYLSHIDGDQSYNTRYHENRHSVNIFGYKNISMRKGVWFINGMIDLPLINRKFDYLNAGGNQRVNRNSFLPNIYLKATYSFFDKEPSSNDKKWRSSFEFDVRRTPMEISMLDAVERVNTTDPLYIRVGNPNLKDANHNSIGFTFTNQHFASRLQQNFNFKFMFIDNAIAEARFYNPANGVTTSRPTNIDGNRSFTLDYGLSTPLFKKQALTFSTNTTANFIRSRDLSSVIESMDLSGNVYAAANVVNTSTIGETLKLDYTFGRHRVSAVGEVRYNDYRSRQDGFNGFSSWTARYGASGVVSLPAGFGLSTDMTVYTRRGFTDARLNTSDVVWNARLTKSIMKGNMTFAVDAYDMLRQLSNITYTVNAQARTEVVSNVVPAYVLFHVMYRFNRQPKR